jgi:NAD-dependent SIR2 family protein deacetylase
MGSGEMKEWFCARCKKPFQQKAIVDGQMIQLDRKVCLECKPYKKRVKHGYRRLIT